MEAKELMIGDWVMSFGAPHKIVGIRTDSFYPYIKTDMSDTWYEEGMKDLLEPIPLTQEILEKSGFDEIDLTKIDGEFYDYFFVLRGKRAGIEKAIFQLSKLRYQSRWEVATNSRDVIIIIKYVHELQHALRLAGIKKEIVL